MLLSCKKGHIQSVHTCVNPEKLFSLRGWGRSGGCVSKPKTKNKQHKKKTFTSRLIGMMKLVVSLNIPNLPDEYFIFVSLLIVFFGKLSYFSVLNDIEVYLFTTG